jgi:hypothetical protein
MMNAQLKCCPDLRACVLEDRLLPAVPNPGLGTIVLTTGGYVLVMSPFPVSDADPLGASGSPGFLTASAMTGSGGTSGLLPANSSGVPTTPTGSSSGPKTTIFVGSGANDIVAPIIPLVTRNTIANDAVNAAPQIGRVSMDRSRVLPPGQVYRGNVPTEVSGQRSGPNLDERPVDPLPIRIQTKPHRLAAENHPHEGDSQQGRR